MFRQLPPWWQRQSLVATRSLHMFQSFKDTFSFPMKYIKIPVHFFYVPQYNYMYDFTSYLKKVGFWTPAWYISLITWRFCKVSLFTNVTKIYLMEQDACRWHSHAMGYREDGSDLVHCIPALSNIWTTRVSIWKIGKSFGQSVGIKSWPTCGSARWYQEV